MADPAAYAFFPALNAILNGTSAVLIACGRHFIKQKRVAAHKRSMIAAVVCSSLFLVSYLYYHWQVGTVRFRGVGWSRPVYFSILGTHTVLAAAIVPLVGTALGLSHVDVRQRDRGGDLRDAVSLVCGQLIRGSCVLRRLLSSLIRGEHGEGAAEDRSERDGGG